jgi:hypothetical protein
MARKPDASYLRAQSRVTREAAEKAQKPSWGTEDPKARAAYDRELRRSMPVDGKGRKGGKK